MITATTDAGTSGADSASGFGGSYTTRCTTSGMLEPVNAGTPETSSYKISPSAKMSVRASTIEC